MKSAGLCHTVVARVNVVTAGIVARVVAGVETGLGNWVKEGSSKESNQC